MNENNPETFITSLNDEKQLLSFDFNDEEMEIDIKSSTDSEDTPRVNTEIDHVLNKKPSQSLLIPKVESMDDEIEDQA